MKKLTSLLLALLLIVSSVSCLWISTVAADTPTLEEYVENPANWTFDQGTGEGSGAAATTIGGKAPNATCTAVNDTTVVLTDSTQSLKMKTPNAYASVCIGDYIKKNRHYKLTVNYQVEKRDGNGRGFASIGLFTPNVQDAKLGDNNDYVVRASGDWSYYFNESGTQIWTSESITTKIDAADCNTWLSLTLEFYSKDYTDLTLVIDSHNWGNVYLDGMQLTDLSAGTQAFDAYVEDPGNWTFDQGTGEGASAAATTIGSKAPNATCTAVNDTTVVLTGSTQSLKMKTPNAYASVCIGDYIEKDHHYKLTIPYLVEKRDGNGRGFASIGLFTPNVQDAKLGDNNDYVVRASGDWSYYFDKSGTQIWTSESITTKIDTADCNTWLSLTLEFYSKDYTDLTLVIDSHNWGNVYLDGMQLTDLSAGARAFDEYVKDPDNWTIDTDQAKTIGSTTPPSYVTKSTDTTTVLEGSASSLKFYAPDTYSTIDISAYLEQNKHYQLTLQYYLDKNFSNNRFHIGVMAPKVENAKLGGNCYVANASRDWNYHNNTKTFAEDQRLHDDSKKLNTTTGAWHTATLDIYTFDYEDLTLVIASQFWGNVYLDGIQLTEIQTFDEYVKDPDNWIIDKDSAKTIGSTTPDGHITKSVDTTKVVEGSTSSLKFYAPDTYSTIDISDYLEQDKHYQLTVKYYLDKNFKDNRFHIGVMAPKVENAKLGGNCYVVNASREWNYHNYTKTFAEDKRLHDDSKKLKTTTGAWHTATLDIYTFDYEDLTLVIASQFWGNLYIGDATLTEVVPLQAESYYEDEANWKFEDGKSKTIGTKPATGVSAVTTRDVVKVGESSLKLNTRSQYAYLALPDNLNKDSKYKLTFWQYSDTLGYDDQQDDGKRYYHALRNVYIFTPDVTDAEIGWAKAGSVAGLSFNGDYVMSGGNAAWNANGNKLELQTDDTGKWHQVSISFETADYENMYLIFTTYVAPIYVDGFTLTEVPHHESVYDGPARELVIDFEAEYPYFGAVKNGRITVDETVGMDGKTTRAMHINERLYDPENQNVTFNNWAKTWSNTDPVFTFPVNGNAAYTMSLKMRVDEWKNMDSTKKLIIYYNYPGDKKILDSYITEYCGDGWVLLTADFITGADEKWISFGIDTANAHPDIWVDDIVLRQHMRGYNGETEKTYCEDFFNLIKEADFATEGKITEKAVIEIPARAITRYTLGINMSGSGKLVLSYDKEQTDVIHTLQVGSQTERYSACVMTGEADPYIYLTFEPSGSGITYDEFHFFMTKAISFGYDLGYTENPNLTEAATYTLEYVGAYDAINGVQTDDVSPETGESMAVIAVVLTTALAAATMFFFRKRREI